MNDKNLITEVIALLGKNFYDRIALFLCYDHPNFNNSFLAFTDIINPEYKSSFMFMAYQHLLAGMKNSFLYCNSNMECFDYIGERYFRDIA